MAQGMNWGIFTLLGVVGLVLGGFAAFFIFLARRSAAVAAQAAEPLLPLMNTADCSGSSASLRFALVQPASGVLARGNPEGCRESHTPKTYPAPE
jgi:hypothetical protein